METILLVDDQIDFCRLAREILSKSPQFSVLAEAYSGKEIVKLVEELEPTCVLVNVEMDGINIFEFAHLIRSQFPDTQVVLMGISDEKEYARLATRVGALAYIPKRDLSAELLGRILNQAQTTVSPARSHG